MAVGPTLLIGHQGPESWLPTIVYILDFENNLVRDSRTKRRFVTAHKYRSQEKWIVILGILLSMQYLSSQTYALRIRIKSGKDSPGAGHLSLCALPARDANRVSLGVVHVLIRVVRLDLERSVLYRIKVSGAARQQPTCRREKNRDGKGRGRGRNSPQHGSDSYI